LSEELSEKLSEKLGEEPVEKSGEEPVEKPGEELSTKQWFVVHTYSGHENKVKANLERAIASQGMQDKFGQVLVATEEVLDTPMDYASVRGVGAELGSASIIVIDDSFTMDWVINKTIHFFKHESCGKCTPCRDGNYWMEHLTEHIHQGQATQNDVELLDSVAKQIQNKCLCALGEFSIQAVMTSIERFPEDFEAKVK